VSAAPTTPGHPARRERSEAGDTLIEVLVSVAILSIAFVALLSAFATSISLSGQHRQVVTLDAALRTASNEAVAQVQASKNNLFGQCPDPAYTFNWNLGIPGFTVTSYSFEYWNGSNFSPGNPCTTYGPQQWQLHVSNTSGTEQQTVYTVIYDPSAPAVSGGVTASKLVVFQPSSTGTGSLNSAWGQQPIVAVEDGTNNEIVYSDASAVSLAIASTSPSGLTGTLSSSCSATENDGVFAFSGCAITGSGAGALGTYTLQATSSNSAVSSTTFSYTISAAPPALLVLTNTTLNQPASATAGTQAVTVTSEDSYGAAVNGPVTVSLSTNSSTGGFSTTPGGAVSASLQVTIPDTASSVTVYYGDTVAGTPTLTASSSGLLSGSQTETITAGAPHQLAVSSSAPTSVPTGQSFAMTVLVQDQWGNTITSTTGNNDTVKLTISTGTLSGTTSVAAGSGQAAFSGLSITPAGSYTITAQDASRSGILTATVPITVIPVPTVTHKANASGTTVPSLTSSAFSAASGTTYLVSVFESAGSAPGTPTLTISTGGTATLVTTNSFNGNCKDHAACSEWTWWFDAASSASTTVKATFSGPTATGAVMEVDALSGNNTSAPIVASSTNTAAGCSNAACSNRTTAITAHTAAGPAIADITIQILASDDSMGSSPGPTWVPGNTYVNYATTAGASLQVNDASPGVQNESSSASAFTGNKDWGTIALEVAHG